jgi:glycine cleavage system aminomethyltransferase T
MTRYARTEESPYLRRALVHAGSDAAMAVSNRMYHLLHYGDPVAEYWALVEGGTLADVAYERQVEISGPDAMAFAQMLTCRDLSRCEVGQCKYIFLTNQAGGIVADPVLLRLDENRVWLSAADAGVHLWCEGLALRSGLDVAVSSPDVAPVQVQGPRAVDIMTDLFGDEIADLGYFRLVQKVHDGLELLISRSGWGEALGFEIYVVNARANQNAAAEQWWDTVLRAGERHDLMVASPNHVRRIEAGMLAYGCDLDETTNPFEVDMGYAWMVNLNHPEDFVGRAALECLRETGPSRRLVGVDIDGPPLGSFVDGLMPRSLDARVDGVSVGSVTSACFSPRLDRNIGYVMLPTGLAALGSRLSIDHPRFGALSATTVEKPHWNP